MSRFPHRLADRLAAAERRLERRMRARARRCGDDGFVLLESIMTISLISIIMAALAGFFINSVASTNQQRTQQFATQVATSAVETLRGIQHPSDIVHGRDLDSVNVQFAQGKASSAVAPWLENMQPASDVTASFPDGATATVPTVGVLQQVNDVDYTVSNYVGWCVVARADSTGNCVEPPSENFDPAAYLTYLRAVVAATWHDAQCSGETCTYVTGTLLSTTSDPAFSLKQAPPPLPAINDPGSQVSMVTDNVSLTLDVEDGTGVPFYTWLLPPGSSLPDGLSLSPTGVITGKPTTPVTNLPVTVQVTDAFTRTATRTFTWTVVPKLTIVQSAQTSTAGKAVSLTLSATGGSGTGYVFTAIGLPVGLSVSGNTIIGTPTTAASYIPQLTVKDSANRTTSLSFNWTILPGPTVTSPGPQLTTLGATINLTLGRTCPDSPCTFSMSGAPAGLTISATTGVITGTVTGTTQANVVVTITDRVGASSQSGAFTWTVLAKPTVTPTNRITTVGAVVSWTVPSTCPNTPCTFTLTGAPTGLSIDGNGVVTGIVGGSAQTYSASTVIITDAALVSVTSSVFTWTVKSPPSVTAPANQASNTGTTVNVPVTSTCPNAPCTFAVAGVPPGLTINANTGVITGTVSGVPQTYSATVTITDAAGVKANSAVFTWTTSYPPLGATAPANQVSTVNTAITPVQLSATGGSGSYAWSGALPSGLSMTSDGLITGIPTSIATTVVSLRVTDMVTSGFLNISFSWTVKALPTVTAPASQTTTTGGTVSLQLTSTCPNAPCSYAMTGGPATLASSSTGLITGTITSSAQTFGSVRITITDSAGAAATTGTFNWTVKAPATVSAPANQITTVGATVNVSGPSPTCPNSPCTIALVNGPPGLSVSSSNVITGTAGGAAQTYSNVTLRITDASGVTGTSGVFTWAVNAPPTVTPTNQTTTVGAVVNWTVPSTCPNTPCTYTMTGAPSGLSISNSGVVTGTVGGAAQTYSNVVVTIKDAANISVASNAFSWTVKVAPTVTSPGNLTTTLGATISRQLTSTCPNTPCSYTFVNPAPPGLSINSSGLITGTVAGSAQTYNNVSVRITDAAGVSATSATFNWTVNATLTLTNPGNQTARGGVVDSLALAALVGGGTSPFTYSATGLPAWLTLNASTGLISGTPPTARSITSGITVSVLDSAGVTVTSAPFQWVVTYPSIAVPNQVTVRNATVSLDLDNYTTGGTAAYTYAFNGTALPAWLTYTSATHVLSGTAPNANNTTSGITVTATDAAGTIVTSAAFSWRVVTSTGLLWSTVADRSSLPNAAIASYDLRTLVAGETVSTFSATGLPPGLSISTAGVVTGTPTLPGLYRVTISANDSLGVQIPSAPFVWQITDLSWSTIPAQTSTRGTADSLDVTLYDSGGVSPLTYAAPVLPAGMTINAATGFISGTPSTRTTYTVTVTATDLLGATVTSNAFTWTVN